MQGRAAERIAAKIRKTLGRKSRMRAMADAMPEKIEVRPVGGVMRNHLYRELAHLRRDGLRASHWVMSPEWFQFVQDLRGSSGYPLVVYGPHRVDTPHRNMRPYLLGIPVHVHPWARIPLLIPCT